MSTPDPNITVSIGGDRRRAANPTRIPADDVHESARLGQHERYVVRRLFEHDVGEFERRHGRKTHQIEVRKDDKTDRMHGEPHGHVLN